MGLDIEAVKKHIKYLREDTNNREFYVALLLYDVLGYSEKDITEQNINKAYEIEDRYDSIYKEELREDLRHDLEEEYEEEYEEEQEEQEEEIEK